MLRGKATFQMCRSAYPDAATGWCCAVILITAYVVARLAKAIDDVTLLADDKPLPEEAALAREAWLNAGGEIHASNIYRPNR